VAICGAPLRELGCVWAPSPPHLSAAGLPSQQQLQIVSAPRQCYVCGKHKTVRRAPSPSTLCKRMRGEPSLPLVARTCLRSPDKQAEGRFNTDKLSRCKNCKCGHISPVRCIGEAL